jgi:tRNA(Arg) A34 adenosine deaminase TadA
MTLDESQIGELKKLMIMSAKLQNLANAAIVLENGEMIASAASLVASNFDATAHSERMLVQEVGITKGTNYTPGLDLISVVEPCLMCMSAASQAGYNKIYYIIQAKRYSDKIPFMTDTLLVDKDDVASKFLEPMELIHLSQFEEEFCSIFEESMGSFLN